MPGPTTNGLFDNSAGAKLPPSQSPAAASFSACSRVLPAKRKLVHSTQTAAQPILSANAGISGVPTLQAANQGSNPRSHRNNPPLVVVRYAEARLPSELMKGRARAEAVHVLIKGRCFAMNFDSGSLNDEIKLLLGKR